MCILIEVIFYRPMEEEKMVMWLFDVLEVSDDHIFMFHIDV